MNEQKREKSTEPRKAQPSPQFQVRSGIVAGASVESCLDNLYYWQNEYYKKCGGKKPSNTGE
jgi:hypothetical protein